MLSAVQQQQILKTVKMFFPNLKLLYAFGSQVTGSAKKDSDLDLAILCSGKIDAVKTWKCAQQIANYMAMDVDLVDLANASTIFRKQLLDDAILLFDDNTHKEFEIATMALYQELNALRAEHVKEYVGSLTNG